MTTTTRTTRLTARVLAALLAALAMVGLSLAMAVVPASAQNDNDGVCLPEEASEFYSGKIDVADGTPSVTITAPTGMLITGYCVKAGSIHQGLGPEYVTVDPPAGSLTITHSSTKDVSHYAFSWAPAPTYAYTPSAAAEETVCTLVKDVWQMHTFGPVTVTGEELTQGTPWTDEQKAAEDAKLQPAADLKLANEESDFDIDRTGESCRTVESYDYTPTATASATACTLVEGTWTADYPFSVTVTGTVLTKGTPWTTEEKAAEDAKMQTEADTLLATVMAAATIDGTGVSCTTTPPPPPPPPPPPTEPEPVTVVQEATVEEPTVVAPVLPATVEEPTEVAIPAAATLPATIPAGEPAPTIPTYALALLLLGTTALAASTMRLVRTTK